jgi:hypothetical protein
MKVWFEESGGYAGLLRGCEIDTSALPPEKAKELEQLVKASGISASGEFLSVEVSEKKLVGPELSTINLTYRKKP